MSAVIDAIKTKLEKELDATSVMIEDDSWKHAGHTAMQNQPQREATHLTIHITSAKFEGQNLIDQHRMVHTILKPEMDTHLHALVLKTATP